MTTTTALPTDVGEPGCIPVPRTVLAELVASASHTTARRDFAVGTSDDTLVRWTCIEDCAACAAQTLLYESATSGRVPTPDEEPHGR